MTRVELWRFINSFAPWVAALGSIFASFVALHLARRDSRPRLEVSAFISGCITHSGHGVVDYSQASFILSITNTWRRPTIVDRINWQVGILKRKPYALPIPESILVATLPKRLNDGETVQLISPLSIFLKDISPAYQSIWKSRVLRNLRLQRMRVEIHTSINQSFYCTLPSHLRNIMIRECPKHNWTDLSH